MDVQPLHGINQGLGNEGGPWPLLVKGETWNLSWPDLGILGEFVKQAKRLAFGALEESRRNLSPGAYEVMNSVVSREMGVKRLYEFGGERCSDYLWTGDGLAYFVWLLARPNHKDLTEADAKLIVKASLEADPGEQDADGNAVRNPYLMQTILDLCAQGKSRPATGPARSP